MVWKTPREFGGNWRTSDYALAVLILHKISCDSVKCSFQCYNISFDPSAPPASDVIAEMKGIDKQLPLFSFSAVILKDISLSIDHFNTLARGSGELPKSVITAALTFIGKYVLNIFNRSTSESNCVEEISCTSIQQSSLASQHEWNDANLFTVYCISYPRYSRDWCNSGSVNIWRHVFCWINTKLDTDQSTALKLHSWNWPITSDLRLIKNLSLCYFCLISARLLIP